MKVEQSWTIKFFALGVFFFHLSGITYSWIAFDDAQVATLVTSVLVMFLTLFFVAAKRIVTKFQIPKELLVTGGFGVDERSCMEVFLLPGTAANMSLLAGYTEREVENPWASYDDQHPSNENLIV